MQPSCCRRLYFKIVLLQDILISEQSFRRCSQFYDTPVLYDPELAKEMMQGFILQTLCWRSVSRTALLQSSGRSSEGARVAARETVIVRHAYNNKSSFAVGIARIYILLAYKIAAKNPESQRQVSCSYLISNFRLVANVAFFLVGYSPASELYVWTFRNTLSVPSS